MYHKSLTRADKFDDRRGKIDKKWDVHRGVAIDVNSVVAFAYHENYRAYKPGRISLLRPDWL